MVKMAFDIHLHSISSSYSIPRKYCVLRLPRTTVCGWLLCQLLQPMGFHTI